MKKKHLVLLTVLIFAGFVGWVLYHGISGADLSASIIRSVSDAPGASPSSGIETSASPSASEDALVFSGTTSSPVAGQKTSVLPNTVTTPTPSRAPTPTAQAVQYNSSTGGSAGGGSGSSTSTGDSGSQDVIGANNALKVKGTGNVFVLLQGGKVWLKVETSSVVTAEVSMTNMAFVVNIISAPTLPVTFSFITKPGMQYFVFNNDTNRYSLVTVPASGLMEYSVTSVPSNYYLAAGYAQATWNKDTPDPVNILTQKPPKNADTAIPGMMFWAYDIGKSYKTSNGSLTGICDSRDLIPAVDQAQSRGTEYACNESAGAFAVSVKLPISGQYVCVDSVGNKIGGTTGIGSNTSCK